MNGNENIKWDKNLVIKYIRYLYDTIDSIYSQRYTDKEALVNFQNEFERFRERINNEPSIHKDLKLKINMLKIEIAHNPRENSTSKLRDMLLFFLGSRPLRQLRDDSNKNAIVSEIRNQLSHLLFGIEETRIFY